MWTLIKREPFRRERIFIELVTLERKVKAPRDRTPIFLEPELKEARTPTAKKVKPASLPLGKMEFDWSKKIPIFPGQNIWVKIEGDSKNACDGLLREK